MSELTRTCSTLFGLSGLSIKNPRVYGGAPEFVPVSHNDVKADIYVWDVWTDGVNVYHSHGNDACYILKNGVWEPKQWDASNKANLGRYVWTDGKDTYYSYSGNNYVLKDGVWVDKVWDNDIYIDRGEYIWYDGTNIRYEDYILKGNTWEKTDSYTSIIGGTYVWTDGTNIYYDCGTEHLKLVNGEWVNNSWSGGPTNVPGNYTWTDGTNVYLSGGTNHHILNGNRWEKISFGGAEFYGDTVWTDGTRIYAGSNPRLVLLPRNAKMYVKKSSGWTPVESATQTVEEYDGSVTITKNTSGGGVEDNTPGSDTNQDIV